MSWDELTIIGNILTIIYGSKTLVKPKPTCTCFECPVGVKDSNKAEIQLSEKL